MKTISISLDDKIYEELSEMLDGMGQTKQTFYESFTSTALRERSIPFIISAPVRAKSTGEHDKRPRSRGWKHPENYAQAAGNSLPQAPATHVWERTRRTVSSQKMTFRRILRRM